MQKPLAPRKYTPPKPQTRGTGSRCTGPEVAQKSRSVTSGSQNPGTRRGSPNDCARAAPALPGERLDHLGTTARRTCRGRAPAGPRAAGASGTARADAELLHHPGAQVLHGDHVAPPAAEEAAEDERREDRDGEEDEPGVHDAGSSVYIDSDGSTGESVGCLPESSHQATWPAIRRLTPISTPARQRLVRDGRTRAGAAGSTGSRFARAGVTTAWISTRPPGSLHVAGGGGAAGRGPLRSGADRAVPACPGSAFRSR